MLPRKPHQFLVQVMVETPQWDRGPKAPSVGETLGPFRGQITPKSAQAALARTGLDITRPHKLLTDNAEISAALLVVGNRVLFDDRVFAIRSPLQNAMAGTVAAHYTLMLEELDHAG